MSVYSLRATALNKQRVIFTVAEAPVILGDNTMILLNHCFSPILWAETIDLGSDVGLFIGDVLRENGKDWFINYNRGFVAQSRDGERKFLYEFDKLKAYRIATENERREMRITRRRLKFKNLEQIFTLYDIIGVNDRRIITSNIGDYVDIDNIQQATLLRLGRRSIYFGDRYRGMPVVMGYGRICVQGEFGLYDILAGQYITRMRGEF